MEQNDRNIKSLKVGIFVIILGCLLGLITIFDNALALSIILVIFFSLITLFLLHFQKYKEKTLCRLFLIVIFIHFGLVLFLHYTQFYPFGGGRDDLFYHETAVEISTRIHNGEFSLQGLYLPQYYPVFLGIIYAFLGPYQLVVKSIGVIFAAISAVLIYLICRNLGVTAKKSFWAGMIVNLYPSYLFYGSLLLKDTLIVPLSLLGLLLSIKLLHKFKIKIFAFYLLDLIALSFLRSYLGITMFLSFAAAFLLFSRIKTINKIACILFITITGCVVPFIFGYGFFGSSIFNQLLNPNFISSFREANYSIGGSSTGIKIDFTNPIGFTTTYIPSVIYVLLGPLPWQIAKLSQLPALFEMIIFYPIIFLALKSFLNPKTMKISAPLLFFGLGLIMAIALFSDNLGANTRLRMTAYMAFACLAPLAMKKYKYAPN